MIKGFHVRRKWRTTENTEGAEEKGCSRIMWVRFRGHKKPRWLQGAQRQAVCGGHKLGQSAEFVLQQMWLRLDRSGSQHISCSSLCLPLQINPWVHNQVRRQLNRISVKKAADLHGMKSRVIRAWSSQLWVMIQYKENGVRIGGPPSTDSDQ